MYNILKIVMICFILNKCSDLLTNDNSYNSVYLNGGGWIQFKGQDLDVLNNDFSLEIWVSGSKPSSDDASMLISVLNDSNELILALSRDISIDNAINLYLNNQMVQTIVNNDLDWSTSGFDLITISSENDVIKIHINKTEVYTESYNLDIEGNDFIVGGKVSTAQDIVGNFWYGYIDEIRLWSKALTDDEISFHIDNPSKLVSSYGCDDVQFTNSIDCEEAGNTWSGGYDDIFLGNLKGLWRFNYNSPQLVIVDESCRQLNLDLGVSGETNCQQINGTIYTLAGSKVEFSTVGM
ncbi:MAG: hypothetical protein CBD97_00995 [Pelagibacteraceae bacterium TMED237]|nr:hypothetical protein [Candidatus Neomarinimicrobiota bacterium]OUW96642.1 MAG: hypothetical protein CBD97_00995 [Pelagibacteraceae bacterium TMED237]|tara:strand:- start:5646 stop:6527 length:882 start_codon:yes stop_codon:yes gene_type:complete